MTQKDRIDQLAADLASTEEAVTGIEARLAEIESRLAEAGRRALFHNEAARRYFHRLSARGDSTSADIAATLAASLAEIGRALLFDPETPDKRGDETP